MENLTLYELITIEKAFSRWMDFQYGEVYQKGLLTIEKIRQAIRDKGFEEKKLNF